MIDTDNLNVRVIRTELVRDFGLHTTAPPEPRSYALTIHQNARIKKILTQAGIQPSMANIILVEVWFHPYSPGMEQSGQGIDKREHPESSGLGRKKKITMAKKVRKNRLRTSDSRGGTA